MKRYELESLFKNFFIFFVLQLILVYIIYLQNYKQQLHNLDDKILKEMTICSYNLKCKNYELDFIKKNNRLKTNYLYKNSNLYALYQIPGTDEFLLKIVLKKDRYNYLKSSIKKELIVEFILFSILIAVVSFLFSLYALYPLKKALKLNNEFIKDILHDINTPLSSILINFKMFKKEVGKNKKIDRIQSSINTILSMQDNLKAFLNSSKLEKEQFVLKKVLEERVNFFKAIYPNVNFNIDISNIKINSNKEAFVRIIDNIISNACKYGNKENPYVKIYLNKDKLVIEDNGIGIKNVKNAFKRYYKENQRGLGLGLNIVKKLCENLNIKIYIDSKLNSYTKVILDLSKLIVR